MACCNPWIIDEIQMLVGIWGNSTGLQTVPPAFKMSDTTVMAANTRDLTGGKPRKFYSLFTTSMQISDTKF